MNQSRLWSTFTLVALGVLGCVSKTVEPPASEPSPAERIAFFGHGKLFDASMNEIRLDDALLKQMQDSMLLEIEQFKGRDPGSEDKAVLAQAQQLLKSQSLAANEAVLLKSGVIHTLLRVLRESSATSTNGATRQSSITTGTRTSSVACCRTESSNLSGTCICSSPRTRARPRRT